VRLPTVQHGLFNESRLNLQPTIKDELHSFQLDLVVTIIVLIYTFIYYYHHHVILLLNPTVLSLYHLWIILLMLDPLAKCLRALHLIDSLAIAYLELRYLKEFSINKKTNTLSSNFNIYSSSSSYSTTPAMLSFYSSPLAVIALLYITLNCAFCISTCIAASTSYISCAFICHNHNRHHQTLPSTLYPNNKRTYSSLPHKCATPDDNTNEEEEIQYYKGVRARVRASISSASQRAQKLLSKSSKTLLEDVSMIEDVVTVPISAGAPIASILTDAAVNSAELAAEEVRSAALSVLQRSSSSQQQTLETQARIEADATVAMDTISLAKTSVADAFDAAESALSNVEKELASVRKELESAKKDATLGLAVAEKAAAASAAKARMITEMALLESLKEESLSGDDEEEIDSDNGDESSSEMIIGPDETLVVTIPKSTIDIESLDNDTEVLSDQRETIKEESISTEEEEEGEDSLGKWQESDFDDITNLSYEDVDYTLSDMAPPFINEDECLVPGEPVVRVEKAPQNSRRIFAGIDIPVAVDDVWLLLTDYPNLQKVVPNLVVNEVLELYDGNSEGKITFDDTLSDAEQCQTIANNMKGAVLKQVGGAKVVGINFSARTTLEVREWPTGMPDFAHFEDEIFEGKSRSTRVRESKGRALTRYVFPRPFALSSLPHKDISMQSIENDDGEFRMYQGVWR